MRTARADVKTAKRYLSQDYDQIKRDYIADKGKELYRKGKTITSNRALLSGLGTATAIGAVVAHKALEPIYGATISTVTASSIAAGGAATITALGVIKERQNRQLRAYYGHSRPKHH